MFDTNNELLSVVKEEPELLKVKSEFHLISSDIKDEQMDTELSINGMEPFINVNSKNYNLNNSNNHLDTVPENKIIYATSCTFCGHKLSPTILDSDTVYSNKADVGSDSNQISCVNESNALEPIVNIEIDEFNVEKLINLNSEVHLGIVKNIRELDRNLIQADKVARAIYNLGLRDACILLQGKEENDLMKTNSSKTQTTPELVIMNSTLNSFSEDINVQYESNLTNNVLANIKRKIIDKEFQKSRDRKGTKPNFIVWNDFSLAKEMPYLPLPALQLMMVPEQFLNCPNDKNNKSTLTISSQQQNYNHTYQQQNSIDHKRALKKKRKPKCIVNYHKIKN